VKSGRRHLGHPASTAQPSERQRPTSHELGRLGDPEQHHHHRPHLQRGLGRSV
jgi:hypothetical protein